MCTELKLAIAGDSNGGWLKIIVETHSFKLYMFKTVMQSLHLFICISQKLK